MPKVIFNSHAYNCKACGWRKEGDKRTLSHAVKLHNRLVHDIKTGDLGFGTDTATVPKPKTRTTHYIETVDVAYPLY